MATSSNVVNQGTQRTDNWQLAPLLTFVVFAVFIVYATWRAFMNNYFAGQPLDQYLSPLYAPYLPEWAHTLGLHWPAQFAHSPQGLPPGLGWMISPALLILWVPAGFRTTCYYYRKAYYRSFFGSPPGCAVGPGAGNPLFDLEAGTLGKLYNRAGRYTGEKFFPLVLQNLHRYFFYLAALFILLLGWDAFAACFLNGWSGIYIGLGTVIMITNVVLLAAYTFSCHSWRHIIGGQVDCFSACGAIGEVRNHAWQRQSLLNANHMEFAWLSLFSVGFADLYIFLVSKGVFADPHISWTWSQIFH